MSITKWEIRDILLLTKQWEDDFISGTIKWKPVHTIIIGNLKRRLELTSNSSLTECEKLSLEGLKRKYLLKKKS